MASSEGTDLVEWAPAPQPHLGDEAQRSPVSGEQLAVRSPPAACLPGAHQLRPRGIASQGCPGCQAGEAARDTGRGSPLCHRRFGTCMTPVTSLLSWGPVRPRACLSCPEECRCPGLPVIRGECQPRLGAGGLQVEGVSQCPAFVLVGSAPVLPLFWVVSAPVND